jgi:hypothetical protein
MQKKEKMSRSLGYWQDAKDKEDFKKEIVESLKKIITTLAEKKNNTKFTKSKNMKVRLSNVLNLKDPLLTAIEMFENMKINYKNSCERITKNFKVPTSEEIIDVRNIILFGILLEIPLRNQSLYKLEFDNHLFKNDQDRYEISYENENVNNKREVGRILSKELSEWIEIYRNKYYPHLYKEGVPLVFLSKGGGQMTLIGFSKLVPKLTLEYMGVAFSHCSFRKTKTQS